MKNTTPDTAEKKIRVNLFAASYLTGLSVFILAMAMDSTLHRVVLHPGVEDFHDACEFFEILASAVIMGCAVYSFGQAMIHQIQLNNKAEN